MMKRNRKRKTKKARGKSHYYSTYVWNTQEKICFLLKMAQTRPFYLLSFFSHDKYSANTINDKSVDGVLGIRTRGGRMVGADKSTQLWRHPLMYYFWQFRAEHTYVVAKAVRRFVCRNLAYLLTKSCHKHFPFQRMNEFEICDNKNHFCIRNKFWSSLEKEFKLCCQARFEWLKIPNN